MSAEIKATVVGAETVVARLKGASAGALKTVRAKVERLGIELQRKVKEQFLSGQALHVRTGRLRRSINERTDVDGQSVTSSVGTNVSYGAMQELGFHGEQVVREHLRRAQSGMARVRAHVRHMNLTARPFLEPALHEMRPRVLAELSQGVV